MELTADHLYNQPDLDEIDAGINGRLVDDVREVPSVRTRPVARIITGAAQLQGGSAVHLAPLAKMMMERGGELVIDQVSEAELSERKVIPKVNDTHVVIDLAHLC